MPIPMKKLVLKPGREKSVLRKHPWIFSGAIQSIDPFTNGDILEVVDANGHVLGVGYCNKKSQIVCRLLAFEKVDAHIAVLKHLQNASHLRRALFAKKANAYRLVNADGDFLPGLIVDKFNDTLVVQIATLGMERLKPLLIDALIKAENPRWIYEKSLAPSRSEEGLKPIEQTLFGREQDVVQIEENGVKFFVDIKKGQKTGFFLDQQAMRHLVSELSLGRKVLNCFSYTGGFSIYALKGGALRCDSVDISQDAIELVKRNICLNDLDHGMHQEFATDVFSYLRRDDLDYDFIVLDPPAFAKKKIDVSRALQGYKEINRLAMLKIAPGGLILTASCSYHIDETLFTKMLFGAALDANRDIRIIESHRLSWDHPQSLYCPESAYLKSFLLYVT